LCIGGFYLACDFRDELGRQMKRDNALKLAARLLSWHTDNSESEIDETLRLSAIALREQADLIRQHMGTIDRLRETILKLQDGKSETETPKTKLTKTERKEIIRAAIFATLVCWGIAGILLLMGYTS
jgi:hypothetical protein